MRLTAHRLRLAGEAALISSAVRAGLGRSGTAHTVSRCEHWGARPRRAGVGVPTATQIDELAAVVRALGGHAPFRYTCLPRALTTWVMLRRRGVDAQVRIGLGGSSAEAMLSHAWVEVAGTPVGADRDVVPGFAALPIERFVRLGTGAVA